ncbi:MAG TPA: hypothetical protein VNF03_17580 [Patescibacteria group bacterium]|nr:hypothetical protein [Patescibacteria group bacterium]
MSGAARRFTIALMVIGLALAALATAGLPAFYESFLYIIFSWIALATSWAILSGYAGYFSFGHGAFFGAGMYTTATLTTRFNVPFLWTLLAAGLIAAALGAGIGAVVFRVKRLRGELFGLLTLAITFVLGTIRAQHAHRRRSRGVPERRAVAAPARLADGHDLSAGPGPGRDHGGRGLCHRPLAPGLRAVRHPRRRGRRRG